MRDAPRWIALSPGRRLVADLSWASLRTPRCLMAARIAVPRARAARAALGKARPPWTVMVAKAFALTALERPALRRVHASLPWPRMLQLPFARGAILVERDHMGEPTLALARFHAPHDATLAELARSVAVTKHGPVSEAKSFRRMLAFARAPWPLRRLGLSLGIALGSPVLKYGGSFAISALPQQGAAILDSVSVLPVFLSYGPMDEAGAMDLHIAFDHRVMDGADAAFALRGIEAALEGPIAAELAAMLDAAPTRA
jgi:hypothetical protein